jgi:hypothetical protein
LALAARRWYPGNSSGGHEIARQVSRLTAGRRLGRSWGGASGAGPLGCRFETCAAATRSCVKTIFLGWHCLLVVDDPGARLSDSRTIRGALVAAVIAALGTSAIAADLSPLPPPTPRHVRPPTAHRVPPADESVPRPSRSESPSSRSERPPSGGEPPPNRSESTPNLPPQSSPPPNPPPRSSDAGQDGVRTAAGPVAGWGTSRGNIRSSANFPTDPSGVIGGKEFDTKNEFSPNLLTEGELSRSASQFQFRRY